MSIFKVRRLRFLEVPVGLFILDLLGSALLAAIALLTALIVADTYPDTSPLYEVRKKARQQKKQSQNKKYAEGEMPNQPERSIAVGTTICTPFSKIANSQSKVHSNLYDGLGGSGCYGAMSSLPSWDHQHVDNTIQFGVYLCGLIHNT